MKTQSQANFGYKIVDRDAGGVAPVLRNAIERRIPLEVGLYHQDPAVHELLNGGLDTSGLAINTHFDHRRLSIFDLAGQETLLRRQIEVSLSWGAGYAVTHVSSVVMTPRPSHREALTHKLLVNLRRLNELCREYGFLVHIENTYHGLGFYRDLFDLIQQNGLERLHACFDFGHAKVWSVEPLRDWLDFLEDLERSGTALHCHLHANRGLADEHLSFVEAERLGITAVDHFTAPWDSYEALSLLDRRFPRARKVFEVPSSLALDNLCRVTQRIDEVREAEKATGSVIRSQAMSQHDK
jgi:sugar phosphate isomerase/epimerase